MSKPHQTHEFAVPPPPAIAWALLLGLPLLAIIGMALLPARQQAPLQLAQAAAIVALVMMVPVLALRRRSIRLQGTALKVAATFFTRSVGIDDIDLDKARIVDLAEHTGFSPRLKLNGFGLPGFKAGHFLLRNRARAFCLLAGDGRTLVLPLRDGKYLLLCPEQPQALLDALRRVAEQSAAR